MTIHQEQMLLKGIETVEIPKPKEKDTFKERVFFHRPKEETLLTAIICVKVEKHKSVEVRLLYDPRSQKVKTLQQGKGKSWKDLGISRKEGMRLRLIFRRMCEKHIKDKYFPKKDLFTENPTS